MDSDIVLRDYQNPHASGPLRLNVRLACNTDNETVTENIRINAARDVPWLAFEKEHRGIAVIVGGGPSASDCLREIANLIASGATVFALNNASRWLGRKGFIVDYQCIIDARPENVEFVDPNAVTHLIASQVHPSVLEAASRPLLMHLMTPGVDDCLPKERREQGYPMLGGGYGVGNTALCAAYTLGFREIHCFGLDSSHRGVSSHAYEQPLNDDIPLTQVEWCGEKFVASLPMKAHAERFQVLAHDLIQAGCGVHVHGDGLLPAMFNPKEGATFRVGCDLAVVPSSYDFLTWLVAADMERRRRGYETLEVAFRSGPEDGFRADNLPPGPQERKRLFENVVRPSLALIGAKEGKDASLFFDEYVWRGVTGAYCKGTPLPELTPSEEAWEFVFDKLGDRRPTVITLREASYWPERNSNLEAWLKFAEECEDVIFVRDTDKADEPLPFETMPEASRDLHIRVALYQRARMNLAVANGPTVPMWLIDVPFRSFTFPVEGYFSHTEQGWPIVTGLLWGEQAPWFTPEQRIVYARDTLENIKASLED